MTNINFFALGGFDEKGKNFYCVEINHKIFIFDAGGKNAQKNILGIKHIIPEFDYLIKNQKRIVGLFLTSPVNEMSAAVPHLIKKIKLKIYSSDLVLQNLKEKFRRLNIKIADKTLNYVRVNKKLNFGDLEMEVFRTTTVFPNTIGFALYTEDGSIVYPGYHIFDQYAKSLFAADMQHWNKIINRQKVLMLICNVWAASNKGFAAPNYLIKPHISAACALHKGRIIFTCGQNDLFKIDEFIHEYQIKNPTHNKTINIIGNALWEIINFLQKTKGQYKNINFVRGVTENKAKCIMIGGEVTWLSALLVQIAYGSNPNLQLTAKDVVILTYAPAKGEELLNARVLDELARTDAYIININRKNMQLMMPHQEDVKLMCALFKPNFFIPCGSLYKDMDAARYASVKAGVNQNNILMLNNGQVVNLKNGKRHGKNANIKTHDNFLEETGFDGLSAAMLKEREQLANEGVVIVAGIINNRTKKLSSKIKISARGINLKNEKTLIQEIGEFASQIINKHAKKIMVRKPYNVKSVISEGTALISKLIRNKIKKRPIVLMVLNELPYSKTYN